VTPRPAPVDPAVVAGELLAARRYAHLCDDAVWRTARWAAGRSVSARDAVKKAKRKLHQVYGAYVTGWKPGLDAEPPPAGGEDSGEAEVLRAYCLRTMALHASTRERIPYLQRFYEEVFAVSGVPGAVLDLGCGLHPLALPWMGLRGAAAYDSVDMDARSVDVVRGFFASTGQAGVSACADLLGARTGWIPSSAGDRRPEQYDLAFLLKTIPCLEQQEKGAGERLLRSVPARRVVVSFALSTIGGGRRQAAQHYDGVAGRLFSALGWSAARTLIGNELVFVARPPDSEQTGYAEGL